jgi:hypothetical protein
MDDEQKGRPIGVAYADGRDARGTGQVVVPVDYRGHMPSGDAKDVEIARLTAERDGGAVGAVRAGDAVRAHRGGVERRG